jgi:hypothetical protein
MAKTPAGGDGSGRPDRHYQLRWSGRWEWGNSCLSERQHTSRNVFGRHQRARERSLAHRNNYIDRGLTLGMKTTTGG